MCLSDHIVSDLHPIFLVFSQSPAANWPPERKIEEEYAIKLRDSMYNQVVHSANHATTLPGSTIAWRRQYASNNSL